MRGGNGMMTLEGHSIREEIFGKINEERFRQDDKWGEQNLPMLTHPFTSKEFNLAAIQCKELCNKAITDGTISWRHILIEEVMEVFAEDNPNKQAEELIQVAAVSISMIECLRRNGKI